MYVDTSNPQNCEVALCSRKAIYEVHQATVKRGDDLVDYGNVMCCSFCRHIITAAIEGRANMPKLARYSNSKDGYPDQRNAIVGRRAPKRPPRMLDNDWQQEAARKADQNILE
jgi:hypothetical protein